MNKERAFIVKAVVFTWVIGIFLIIVGGLVVGVQKPEVALVWLEKYLTGTSAIFTLVIGYYFGERSNSNNSKVEEPKS